MAMKEDDCFFFSKKLFYKDSTLQSFIISEGHAYIQMISVDWVCYTHTDTHTTAAIPHKSDVSFLIFSENLSEVEADIGMKKLAVITACILFFLFLPSHSNWSGHFLLNPNIYICIHIIAYEYFD